MTCERCEQLAAEVRSLEERVRVVGTLLAQKSLQLEALARMACGECGRPIAPSGQCWACETDRLRSQIDTMRGAV